MAYKVIWKKSVSKDFKEITEKLRGKLFAKIEKELSQQPTQGEKLRGKFTGLYKRRIGDYRVIYTITPQGVLVLRVRHRKNAYK